MITVTPRARRRDDRAGDPLDGLVNLFDLGIVLAVAFLLAALSSLHLTAALAKGNRPAPPPVDPGAPVTIHTLPHPAARPPPASRRHGCGRGSPCRHGLPARRQSD